MEHDMLKDGTHRSIYSRFSNRFPLNNEVKTWITGHTIGYSTVNYSFYKIKLFKLLNSLIYL
uniref:Uncharacterized protein n=1 Tax=Lepeophtheirus salmonis TaxID=72036 RepID=A0A0K2VK82_LEPSM